MALGSRTNGATLLLVLLSFSGCDSANGPASATNGTRNYSGTLDYARPVGLSRSLRFSLPRDEEAGTGRYLIFQVTSAGTVLTGHMTCSDATAGSFALGQEGMPVPH